MNLFSKLCIPFSLPTLLFFSFWEIMGNSEKWRNFLHSLLLQSLSNSPTRTLPQFCSLFFFSSGCRSVFLFISPLFSVLTQCGCQYGVLYICEPRQPWTYPGKKYQSASSKILDVANWISLLLSLFTFKDLLHFICRAEAIKHIRLSWPATERNDHLL